jgi:uncharacterized delta-60 repeat protein
MNLKTIFNFEKEPAMIRPLALLLVLAAAGCDDDQGPAPTPDMTTGNQPDMTTTSQLDMTIPSVPVTVGQPIIMPLAPAGHDRFYGVTFDSAGSIYATGQLADDTATMINYKTLVAKFTPAGALDTSFNGTGFAVHDVSPIATDNNDTGERARGIVVQPSGKVVVLVTVIGATVTDRNIALVRWNANGTLDTTFGDNATPGVLTLDLSAGNTDQAYGLSMYSDGRLLVNGATLRPASTDTDWVMVRLSVDGALDNTFGTNGVYMRDIANRSASPRTSTILSDGSIVGAGYYTDGAAGAVVKPALFKVTPAGLKDTTFGTDGYFTATVLMAVTETYGAALQGTSFVTAGYGRDTADNNTTDWVSLRVNAAGQLDTTYGNGGYARIDLAGFADNARTVLVLPDNRVLLAGGGRPTMADVDAMFALLTENGQLDTSFGTGGKAVVPFGGASDFVWGLAMDPTNKKVVAAGIKGGVTAGNDDSALLFLNYGN